MHTSVEELIQAVEAFAEDPEEDITLTERLPPITAPLRLESIIKRKRRRTYKV